MNASTTPLHDVLPLAQAAETSHTIGATLRHAMARAEQLLRGTDQEAARTAYLAQAEDPADLERRAVDWDRAQVVYRALPPTL